MNWMRFPLIMKIGPILNVLRPLNGILAGAAVLCGSIVENEGIMGLEPLPVIFLSLAAFFIVGGSNILNDISDIEIDRKGHPERALPSDILTLKEARSLFLFLWPMGIFLGAFASFLQKDWLPIIIIALTLFIIILYEKKLKCKGLPGNLIIGATSGLTFFLGASVTGSFLNVLPLFLMAFFATTSREITKDIEDLQTDRTSRRTLPMRLGVRNASIISVCFMITAILISIFPIFIMGPDISYLLLLGVADLILSFSIYQLSKDPSISQKLAKLGMLCAVAGFLVWSIL